MCVWIVWQSKEAQACHQGGPCVNEDVRMSAAPPSLESGYEALIILRSEHICTKGLSHNLPWTALQAP